MSDSAQTVEERMVELTLERNGLVDTVASLARQISHLKGELSRQRQDDPKMQDAREVFDYWVDKLGKTKRTTWGPARQKCVLARLSEKALTEGGDRKDDLFAAVRGMSLKPYVGPQGRQEDDSNGAKRHDDLTLICRDETTVERFAGYALEQPVPIRQPGVPQEVLDLLARGDLDRLVERCDCGHVRAEHTFPLQELWCPPEMVGWEPCTARDCTCMDFDGLMATVGVAA